MACRRCFVSTILRNRPSPKTVIPNVESFITVDYENVGTKNALYINQVHIIGHVNREDIKGLAYASYATRLLR